MTTAEVPSSSTTGASFLTLTRLDRDGQILIKTLEAAHLPASLCPDVDTLCRQLPFCLAAILTIEALDRASLDQIAATLAQQPPWSDVPLVILTGRTDSLLLHKTLRALGNVTFLERPLHQSSLLSVVESARRARRRQFEVRDLLHRNRALTGELHVAHRQTAEIADSIDEAFYAVDTQWRLTYVNPIAERWWGKRRHELLGHNLWELFPGVKGTLAYQELLTAQSQRLTRHFEVLSQVIDRWIAADVYPTNDGLIVFLRDITEQREVRLQIEALNAQLRRAMTETHHRVKNNLQLIAALVDMYIMEDKSSVSIADLSRLGRQINTLAMVHDILTQETRQNGEGDTLSLKKLMESLLPLMQQTVEGRRIRSRIEEARLATRQCTSLAMIVNELVANAFKYSPADVDVTFAVRNEQAFLSIGDHGEGFPLGFDPVKAAHTGLDLVLNLTRHDLNGSITFENGRNGGGYVTLVFPLSASCT